MVQVEVVVKTQKKTNRGKISLIELPANPAGIDQVYGIMKQLGENVEKSKINYKVCALTTLLQETLGGNAKAMFVCCIDADQSCCDVSERTIRYC